MNFSHNIRNWKIVIFANLKFNTFELLLNMKDYCELPFMVTQQRKSIFLQTDPLLVISVIVTNPKANYIEGGVYINDKVFYKDRMFWDDDSVRSRLR